VTLDSPQIGYAATTKCKAVVVISLEMQRWINAIGKLSGKRKISGELENFHQPMY
jgi:hypothetical protein